jgi:sec-independent protein translocase protein TatA
MSMANLGAHWWVILIIVVLLFGAPKLPALARSMGQSMRIFKNEIKTKDPESEAPTVPPTADRPTGAAYTGDTVKSTEPGDTASKP